LRDTDYQLTCKLDIAPGMRATEHDDFSEATLTPRLQDAPARSDRSRPAEA
jgi:hypothetical protein